MKIFKSQTPFWDMVHKTPTCWVWLAKVDRDGYGCCKRLGEWLAHRVAWKMLRGPIQQGLEIDHLCRNRRCVNPDHMEPVTKAMNALRGISPPAINARKTACRRGHAFNAENTYVWRGVRICRPCRRAAEMSRRRRRRNQIAQVALGASNQGMVA
jgi:hypothetical protein